MDNPLEEKLGAILSNPDMMQKIQALAASLGQSAAPSNPPDSAKAPEIDLAMMQKLASMAGQTGIDQNQQTLLSALTPYLSQGRVRKLENAMRAAKLAQAASGLLGSGGLQQLLRR